MGESWDGSAVCSECAESAFVGGCPRCNLGPVSNRPRPSAGAARRVPRALRTCRAAAPRVLTRDVWRTGERTRGCPCAYTVSSTCNATVRARWRAPAPAARRHRPPGELVDAAPRAAARGLAAPRRQRLAGLLSGSGCLPTVSLRARELMRPHTAGVVLLRPRPGPRLLISPSGRERERGAELQCFSPRAGAGALAPDLPQPGPP